MTGSSAEKSAENVAAALVGNLNAVADHKCGASDVVCNYANGDISLSILAVLNACDLANCIKDLSDSVNLEEVVNVLHYTSKSFKTHTCVDILSCELGVVALAVVVELREYVVPDLDKAVALAAGVAVGV